MVAFPVTQVRSSVGVAHWGGVQDSGKQLGFLFLNHHWNKMFWFHVGRCHQHYQNTIDNPIWPETHQ